MARTQVKSGQLEDEGIWREDLNVSTTGKAVVRKLIQGTGISLSSTGVDSGTGDVEVSAGGSYSALIGNGSATAFNITQATHGRAANRTLIVKVLEESTGDEKIPDITIGATGTVTLGFGFIPATNEYRVIIV